VVGIRQGASTAGAPDAAHAEGPKPKNRPCTVAGSCKASAPAALDGGRLPDTRIAQNEPIRDQTRTSTTGPPEVGVRSSRVEMADHPRMACPGLTDLWRPKRSPPWFRPEFRDEGAHTAPKGKANRQTLGRAHVTRGERKVRSD